MTALITQVHQQVEVPGWAPWLRFTVGDMHDYAEVFPQGQFVDLGGDGSPIGALTTIRLDWSGDPGDLTSWDEVSGRDTSVAEVYDEAGNTLVLLSMSVRPEARGAGPSTWLMEQARALARSEHMEHIVGPFRPSGYGARKRTEPDTGFTAWCRARRPDGQLADPWLRAMTRLGMKPLREEPRAMVIEEDLATWEGYRIGYRPDAWFRVTGRAADLLRHESQLGNRPELEVWECGETGSWFVDREARVATYCETNLWGEVPFEEEGGP